MLVDENQTPLSYLLDWVPGAVPASGGTVYSAEAKEKSVDEAQPLKSYGSGAVHVLAHSD